MQYLQIGIIFLIVILAMWTDRGHYRINNSYLLIGSTLGFFINIKINGLHGFLNSLLGLLFPMIILFILFVLRMLGAGDIKLFATIGAIMGYAFVLRTMLYSFCVGGGIALIVLLYKKALILRLKYFADYMIRSMRMRKFNAYYDIASEGYTYAMHFSYAIAASVTIQVFMDLKGVVLF